MRPSINAPIELPPKPDVQYSLLMTFKRPSKQAISTTVEELKVHGHLLHSLANLPSSCLNAPDFWVEMQMTAANGHNMSMLMMPAGMGEAAAQKNPERDFTSLILGHCLVGLHKTSLDAIGIPDMRCVIPLAEVRLRDIVQYRNMKLGLKAVGLENIGVRCDSVQSLARKEHLAEPILA